MMIVSLFIVLESENNFFINKSIVQNVLDENYATSIVSVKFLFYWPFFYFIHIFIMLIIFRFSSLKMPLTLLVTS